MYIVSALRPRKFVELGTYHDVSYFAFCQAVKSVNSDTKCYAVDTWQGDEHAGEIEPEILPKLQFYNDSLYADFSRLVQSTFDDANEHFAEGSIDLLHIDGLHTYEAVRHDFETWLPQMSHRGIVLFHDVNVRERGFGVWKFWSELCEKYQNFTFLHGHGLGVLAVGVEFPEGLQNLFAADKNETVLIRRFFHQCGVGIDAMQKVKSQKEHIEYLQTYKDIVINSRLTRAYKALKFKGINSLFKKAEDKKR